MFYKLHRDFRNSDFNRFICDDLATSWKNLVNFGSITPEFKTAKMYTPRRSADWLRGATARRLDLFT